MLSVLSSLVGQYWKEGNPSHPAILSLDLRGNSADQKSIPLIMIEGKNYLCYTTKIVEYYPKVCMIDNCFEYLYTK